MTDTPIAVIGAGSWGTALSLVLARNQQQVRLWGRNDDHHLEEMIAEKCNRRFLPGIPFPDHLTAVFTVEEALEGVDTVLVVVPSQAFKSVLPVIKRLVPHNLKVLWATKGLSAEGELLSTVATSILGDSTPLAVLSGPSFAGEVAKALPAAVCLAGNDPSFVKAIVQRMQCDDFRLEVTDDMIGVQIGAVVKNVLAIATGISDGQQLGANARAALLTQGLHETELLIKAMGGCEATVLSLAVVGDIILTCTDNQSRNRRFGLAIGQGRAIKQAFADIAQEVEGYQNTRQLAALVQQHQLACPIILRTNAVLFAGHTIQGAYQGII